VSNSELDDSFLKAVASAPAKQPPRDPERLGRFALHGRLGAGGMGVVYRASDDTLAREVALKVLPAEVAGDGERRERFLREARLAAALTHSNIATVYDIGESDGWVFIAMELIEGRSLRAVLAEGPLAVPEAVRVVREVARALARAHDKGIIHRDLKPDNVMVTTAGDVKVLDFGLAKRTEHAADPSQVVTGEDKILGTPSYMSPEQATGKALDARSDLFSLGVMFYELVTATRPFRGDTAMETAIAIARDEPPPPSALVPAIGSDLDRVILRCLRKLPGERYASAAELLDELGRVSPAPLRRSRWRFGLAAVGVVAIAGGATWWRLHERPRGGVAMTAQPAPSSASPDALRAYHDGLVAFRDSRFDDSRRDFDHAIERDPELAAAHLRRAILCQCEFAEGRDSFHKALARRGALDARDRGLLDAWEPAFQRQPADETETVRRMQALAASFPEDAEIAANVGIAMTCGNSGGFAAQLAQWTRALELDPQSGLAWMNRGAARAYLGDLDGARADYNRCLSEVPAATNCLFLRIDLESSFGEASAVEADARRWLTIEPDAPPAYDALADALACQGRPEAAIREVFRERRGRLPEEARGHQDAVDERALAVLRGDFPRAIDEGAALLAQVESSGLEADHAAAVRAQSVVLEEIGRSDQAASLASSFLTRRDAWEPNPRRDDWAAEEDPTTLLLSMELHAGTIAADQFRTQRDARVAVWERDPAAAPTHAFLWMTHYADGVATAAEASDAVAALARFEPLPKYALEPRSDVFAAVGRTYLLAGRVADASAMLRRAAAACDALRFPVEHIRASFDLGEALAAAGDKASACAAYREVLSHWGNASASRTASLARSRADALGCAR
jgi:serine/threonine-protein kinase